MTIEEPVHLAQALNQAETADVVLVDCLTLWLSHLMFRERDPEIEARRLRVVSSLAFADDGGAITAAEASARRDVLEELERRPLEGALRQHQSQHR